MNSFWTKAVGIGEIVGGVVLCAAGYFTAGATVAPGVGLIGAGINTEMNGYAQEDQEIMIADQKEDIAEAGEKQKKVNIATAVAEASRGMTDLKLAKSAVDSEYNRAKTNDKFRTENGRAMREDYVKLSKTRSSYPTGKTVNG